MIYQYSGSCGRLPDSGVVRGQRHSIRTDLDCVCLKQAKRIVCKATRHGAFRRLERLGRRLSGAFASSGYRCSQVLGVLEAGQNGYSLLAH